MALLHGFPLLDIEGVRYCVVRENSLGKRIKNFGHCGTEVLQHLLFSIASRTESNAGLIFCQTQVL